MFEVGAMVQVKEPFKRDFPAAYEITEVVVHDDGQTVYILSDDAGGFDPKFLESV